MRAVFINQLNSINSTATRSPPAFFSCQLVQVRFILCVCAREFKRVLVTCIYYL